MKPHRHTLPESGSPGQNTHIVKHIGLIVALTGAKFTPAHHRTTGDHEFDSIMRGDHIPSSPTAQLTQIIYLFKHGVRFFHIHARNPRTREQSCEPRFYRELGIRLRKLIPDIILSYGGSRNGAEIVEAISRGSEWSRLQHASLSLAEGGAQFVTTQAAAELKIPIDLERQGYLIYTGDHLSPFKLVKDIQTYVPDAQWEDLAIGAFSTAGGGNYGRSSARIQLEVLRRAASERARLGLPHEHEWTQLVPSYTLTKLWLDHFAPELGKSERLNITILFGFSARLRFPLTYKEFREAVDLARSLRNCRRFPNLNLTVSVGAAVLPSQAEAYTLPLDIGPYAGKIVGPLERIIAYACMPESEVDMLRFGLEDTPYLTKPDGKIKPATNLDLGRFVLAKLPLYGGKPMTDAAWLRRFAGLDS